MRCFASKPRRGLPFIFSLLFLGLLSLPGFASAQTVAEPVKARDAPDRAMAAIVTGVDQLVCSATVIGPRHVLTAATCVIDPETDAVLADRQVMPRVDLDDGYIPTARRFIRRVFVPVDGAPFGPSDRFEGKLAIVETAELVEHPPFSAETDEAAFDRRETEGDDGILTIRFYDRATGGQMTTSACAALSIAPGDIMAMNCALPEGASGAAIRVASGITGLYLYPGAGRYIGNAEVEAIGRVVTGAGSPFFRAIEATPDLSITFVLSNRCDAPIDYSLRYRPVGGGGDFTTVSGRIESGQRRFVDLMTDNGVVYMRGTAKDGALVWDGGRVFEDGRYFDIRINSWGDYFHSLSCDE
ncbi:MAG: hypothetical protein CML23_20130 [Rhizobiaceae bacterium]|nr:hypothetical protein [Rhizobiaceae bacterium]